MEIITCYQKKNPSYTRARAVKPVGVLVHSTGAVNSYLKRYVDCPERLGTNTNGNTWNRADAKAGMHAFIGRDKDGKVIVANVLPYDYACGGCGRGDKGSYNYNPTGHLQFEICEGTKSDAAYYKEAIATAEEYCAYLCTRFGLTADDITSHYEAHAAGYASNHDDPKPYMRNFGDNMDAFRERVRARMGEVKETMATYQAIINSSKDAGIGLWTNSKKADKVLQMPKGAVVEVLTDADARGFCKCAYNGKTGWADAQYLKRVEAAPTVETVQTNDVLKNLYAARDALNAAIKAAGGA